MISLKATLEAIKTKLSAHETSIDEINTKLSVSRIDVATNLWIMTYGNIAVISSSYASKGTYSVPNMVFKNYGRVSLYYGNTFKGHIEIFANSSSVTLTGQGYGSVAIIYEPK